MGYVPAPLVNATYPNPRGPSDYMVIVLSPKADRIVYSSYLDAEADSLAGIGFDDSGSVVLGGTENDWVWDGRSDVCPLDGYNTCSDQAYFVSFGPLRRSSLPATLNFQKRKVGTTTQLKLSLKNTGNVPLSIAGVNKSGSSAFALLSNTCTSVLMPDATCAMVVTFTPSSKGLQTGDLVVSSDSLDSPQTTLLTGTGQ